MTAENPNIVDVSALRELVRSGPRTAGRNAAFIELVAQNPPGLNRTLRALALNPEIDQPMRLKAVSALGRTSVPSSLAALREVLQVEDGTVRRRAFAQLGKVGTVDDLDALRAVRTGNRATQRTLRTAKRFLSYRHRLGLYRHDVPSRTFGAREEDAVELRIRRPQQRLRTRLDAGELNVPGLDLTSDEVWSVVCGREILLFVASSPLAGDRLLSIADQQAVPGVLMTENPETGMLDAAFYMMTDPIGNGGFAAFGVRGTGRVALFGAGTVDGDDVHFELRASQNPLVHPFTVRSTYATASCRLHVETALVESQFASGQQRLRRQPVEG